MNIIGIYPGSFQPPHAGHFKTYEILKNITGVNTFVTTSDKVELPQSPLTFQDKQQIWTRHGVPIDKVVMAKDPNKAAEVTKKFGTDRTIVLFVMTKKDADLAFSSGNGYYLPFKGIDSLTIPMNKNAYVLVVGDNIINPHPNVNADMIRKAFGSTTLPEEKKKSFFKQIFGWYDISLFDLIKKKFAEAGTVKERVNEDCKFLTEKDLLNFREIDIIRRTLKPFVKEVLDELVTPQSTQQNIATDVDQQAAALSPADASKQARLKKDLAKKKLKDLQMQLDLRKKKKENDRKQGDLDTKNLDTQVKALKREI
jgi:hypothetical protein